MQITIDLPNEYIIKAMKIAKQRENVTVDDVIREAITTSLEDMEDALEAEKVLTRYHAGQEPCLDLDELLKEHRQ